MKKIGQEIIDFNNTNENLVPNNSVITSFSINAQPGAKFKINGSEITIGNTCMFQLNNFAIYELKCLSIPQENNSITYSTIIDYVYEEGANNV